MSWNYRVVRRLLPNGEVEFGIHEAFYEEGCEKPDSITTSPVSPVSETYEGLLKEIEHFKRALLKEVLFEEDFEKEPKKELKNIYFIRCFHGHDLWGDISLDGARKRWPVQPDCARCGTTRSDTIFYEEDDDRESFFVADPSADICFRCRGVGYPHLMDQDGHLRNACEHCEGTGREPEETK